MEILLVIYDEMRVIIFENFYVFFVSKYDVNLFPDALEPIDLKLVGPFDVLSGSVNEETVDSDAALRHWRYYYDPPEFQVFRIYSNL